VSQAVYIGFFLVFLNVFTDKKAIKIFLNALILTGLMIGGYAILQQLGIGIFSEHSMQEFLGRSFATLGHPNFLGQYLLFPIWASIYFILQGKTRTKLIYLSAALILIIALLFTENRASILGLVISAVVFVLFNLRIKNIYKYAISGGLIVSFIAFILMFASSLRSITTRLYLWDGSLQVFTEHPIFGSGLETFSLVFQKVADSKFFELEKLYSIADRAHNEFLDILVMQGTFGLVVYLSIIVGLLYLAFFKNRSLLSLCLGSTLISVLIANSFGFSLTTHYFLFAALIAFILNNGVKFSAKKIRRNIFTTFLSGALIAFLIFASMNSAKIIMADDKYLLGTKHIYGGNSNYGLFLISEATNLNPHQGDIYFQLADILFLFGRNAGDTETYEKALEALEYAGQFTGYGFRYEFAKARLNAYLEDFEEAEISFAKAGALAPINPIIKKEWAVMYYLMGDYKKCIEKMEEFLDSIPEYWRWKNILDEISFEDQEKYRLFMKHVPDFWDTAAYISRAYAEIGDVEQSNYYLQYIEDEEAVGKITNIQKGD